MKLTLYLLRWQLSTLTLYPVLQLFGNGIWGVVIANLIGGLIFFGVDKIIFTDRVKRRKRMEDVSDLPAYLRLVWCSLCRSRKRNGKR